MQQIDWGRSFVTCALCRKPRPLLEEFEKRRLVKKPKNILDKIPASSYNTILTRETRLVVQASL